MSAESLLALIGGSIVIITIITLFIRRLPKRIKSAHYVRKWREIQRLCSDRTNWVHAVIHADMLLDEVLVKKRITGNTMGERMVSAQNSFTANDKLWDAHKLATALRSNGDAQMSEVAVKDTLITFRQALRDLGAL